LADLRSFLLDALNDITGIEQRRPKSGHRLPGSFVRFTQFSLTSSYGHKNATINLLSCPIDYLINLFVNSLGSQVERAPIMTEFRTLLVLFVLGSLSQASAQPLRAQDDAAIRQQLAGYAEARTQGSGEKQASFYAEDGDEWELCF
jgi:hypothetical protein